MWCKDDKEVLGWGVEAAAGGGGDRKWRCVQKL